MDINEISGYIVDGSLKVHSALGPGLLENAHEACLKHELAKRGLRVESQVPLPVTYDGVRIELGYPLDLLVNNSIIVELKSVNAILDVHRAQVISYLRLSGHKLGLLLNLNVAHMKDGIHRFANNL